MTRVLRSSVKKNQVKGNLTSKLSECKNTKAFKKNSNKKVLSNSGVVQKIDIWNISSIISNIFEYTQFKDIVNLNTVSKRWNQVTNPFVHKSIKLLRDKRIMNKSHDKRYNRSAKTDAEVEMCIINNLKHAKHVKEVDFNENIEPRRAIQFFEKFRFITNLTISVVTMSQDQFISLIIPLTQLQELNLSNIGIKKIVKKSFVTEPAFLPQSLTKLTLVHTRLYNNPELFVKTINSHVKLVEYSFISSRTNFLDPFFRNYPTLKIFEYGHQETDYSQLLIKVFESNPQLKKLKLPFSPCNSALMSSINSHLYNLEEFNFAEYNCYRKHQAPVVSKFTNPTKIKKLSLAWDKLSQCSLNSILLNCPYLEELYLKHSPNYPNDDSDISFNFPKLANIKKLMLRYNHLSKISYNPIIMKCSLAKELDIELPRQWREFMEVIGCTCANLESLIVGPSNNIWGQERETFYQEFYKVEFSANNSLYKSTITHLTIRGFNFYESKAEYFKIFPKLKYINYPDQFAQDGFTTNQENNLKDLWPNYKFVSKNNKYNFDVKMVKILP